MPRPSPITSLDEARSAYRKYLVYFEAFPWVETEDVSRMKNYLIGLSESMECDPPDHKTMGWIYLGMDKDGSGSSFLLDCCPDKNLHGHFVEAGIWIKDMVADRLQDSTALAPKRRRMAWKAAKKRRLEALRWRAIGTFAPWWRRVWFRWTGK